MEFSLHKLRKGSQKDRYQPETAGKGDFVDVTAGKPMKTVETDSDDSADEDDYNDNLKW